MPAMHTFILNSLLKYYACHLKLNAQFITKIDVVHLIELDIHINKTMHVKYFYFISLFFVNIYVRYCSTNYTQLL